VDRDEDRYHIIDEQRRIDATSGEKFDRIAFAMRALRLLRPRMTVAVYPRSSSLEVEQVYDRSKNGGVTWATLGVPPDASRAHIALAVAELAGERRTDWVLDFLVGSNKTAPSDV
jgi:hypothetical protein